MEFIDIWNLLAPQGEYKRRKRACTKLWQSYDPAQQQRIYDAISKAKGNGEAVNNNPYFAIEDAALALLRRQPEFLRGDEPGPIVQVKYNGFFKLCRRETAEQFNLKIVKLWQE